MTDVWLSICLSALTHMCSKKYKCVDVDVQLSVICALQCGFGQEAMYAGEMSVASHPITLL